MSTVNKKVLVGCIAAALTISAGAFAQDRYDPRQGSYDDRYDPRQNGDDVADYDYAKVVDVQPLTTRVRVTTPQRECWDETRYDNSGGYQNGPMPNNVAGGTLLGAVIGAAIGNQFGHGQERHAATAGGAIVGAAIGHQQAVRRNVQNGVYATVPPREYTVQRCETRYHDEYQERVDGYRVTYLYHGRRQVTEMPNRPGDRIRVRVDVSPAE
jgi:uncharacterized protein YcfJ